MQLYYILNGDEQEGPFSLSDLRQKLKGGECTKEQLAWHEGQTEWKPLERLLPTLPPVHQTASLPPLPPVASPVTTREEKPPNTEGAKQSETPTGLSRPPVAPLKLSVGLMNFGVACIAAALLSYQLGTALSKWTGLDDFVVQHSGIQRKLDAAANGGLDPARVGRGKGHDTSLAARTKREQDLSYAKHALAAIEPGYVNSAVVEDADMHVGTPAKAQDSLEKKVIPPALKNEILALLRELEGFRHDPQFHSNGFTKDGRWDWMQRIDAILKGEERDTKPYYNAILAAASNLKSIGEEYWHSKGVETDVSRVSKELFEEALPGTNILTLRERADFVLNRYDLFGDVPVKTLGDMIAGTMGERIPKEQASRVVFKGGTGTTAHLKRYDAEMLLYETHTSKGESVLFALKRTPDLDRQIAEYSIPAKLFDDLIRDNYSYNYLDPLRQGHVLLTIYDGCKVDLAGHDEILRRYLSATGGKVRVSGSMTKVWVCSVRVIQFKETSSKVVTPKTNHEITLGEVDASKTKNEDYEEGFILFKTSLYADTDTLQTMLTESEKGGEAGTEALKRFVGAGKIWTEDDDLQVRVLERGGPMGGVFVEAVNGRNQLKASRFWVLKDELLPLSHPASKFRSLKLK